MTKRIVIILNLFVLLPVLCWAESPETVTAPAATSVAAERIDVALVSRSKISSLTAGDNVRHYRDIEQGLLNRLEQKLLDRQLVVKVLQSENDMAAYDYKNVLAFKIETVEFGFRHPFGRHTNVTVSYVFQARDGTALAKGEYKEHSNKGWKNCVRTISEKIASDVADRLSGKEVIRKFAPNEAGGPAVSTPNSTETRLKNLEELKAKGLITEKEYSAKRREILKEL